jgi:mannose-6-phosphate isomerase-like protein (cupin superfamily)
MSQEKRAMKHPYLIDLNDSQNWLYPVELINPDGTKGEDQRTINMPEGSHRLFHVTDSVMYPSKKDDLHCHEHQTGYEDFFVDDGGLDLYINGKKTYVAPGNIIHLQPLEAHGMQFHHPTKYRGFFHDLRNSDYSPDLAILRAKKPDAMKDSGLMKLRMGNADFVMREQPEWIAVPPEQVAAVRNIGRPMAAFKLEGVTMKMITARWENGGVNELWAAEMDAGFHAEWEEYPTNTEMYYVTSGEIKFKVYDDEFIAYPECVVKIPKFASHSILAQTKAVMYDIGGLSRWYAFLQDRSSILKYDPERANKPETMVQLKTRFGCQIKSIGLAIELPKIKIQKFVGSSVLLLSQPADRSSLAHTVGAIGSLAGSTDSFAKRHYDIKKFWVYYVGKKEAREYYEKPIKVLTEMLFRNLSTSKK